MPDFKDSLPKGVDPTEAVRNLSKSQSGALYIISISIVIPLIGMIVWLGINRSDDIKKERADAIKQCEYKLDMMQKKIDSLYLINRSLKDSLFMYNIFRQYNISQGEKQIILMPKNEKK